jgi:hypothetical protein
VTLPLWITGMVVDGQRWLPLLGTVHTADIHSLEAFLFPAARGVTWPEWFVAAAETLAWHRSLARKAPEGPAAPLAL